MNLSKTGADLIKHFESCKLEAYLCPAGVWTIGWGHIKGVVPGMVITQEEADTMFIDEIEEYETYINNIDVDLEQHQFDALVSWVYNLGPANLQVSTLLKRLKAGDYWDIPDQIRRWNKANGKVLTGLIRRREAEALMFAGKDWKAVSS